MSNVAHSTLTGSDLHESKGVAAAAANKVFVTDGAGSGSWGTVPQSALASSAKAFEAQLLHVRDSKNSGTNSDARTASAWTAHPLQTTVTNEITSASLASNQLSLPSGTYFAQGKVALVCGNSQKMRIKLRSITDSTDLVLGLNDTSASSSVAFTSAGWPELIGRFTISGTKTIELQYYTESIAAVSAQSIVSTSEIYADLLIWKVA